VLITVLRIGLAAGATGEEPMEPRGLEVERSDMSAPMSKTYEETPQHVLAAVEPNRCKVLIPYDGSTGAETAIDDLKRAGLPQKFEALVAVTEVWLPSSPYEITRAVSARRLKLLTSGLSSFAPAMRDCEEQRVLSREADHRIRSMFPSANVTTEGMQESTSVMSAVVQKAKSYGAELIVLGAQLSPSPNITDYAGPALGVARAANCSVRIARPSERNVHSPIHIVIGLDETQSMERIIEAVSERVWPVGTKVDVVVIGELRPRDPLRESETIRTLEEFVSKLRAGGANVSIARKYGEAEELLLEHAKDISADCIFIDANIMARGQGTRTELSDVAQSVVLGARSSVEIVRQGTVTREHWKPAA
jgi:nucleotide-binding universal stress UspA family protein